MKKKTLLTILIGAGVGIAISAGIIAIEVHKRKKEEEYVPVENTEPVHLPYHPMCRCEVKEDLVIPPLKVDKPYSDDRFPISFQQAEDPISYLRTKEPKESEVEEEIEEEAEPEQYTDSIKIISVDEFYCPENDEKNSKYEKVSLDYFSLDDTLSDEQGEAILTPEKIIGEALEHFGEQSKDPDIVYVRNEDVTTDFEIVRHEKSYSEYVLGYGYPEDEEKRHPKERDED